MKTIHSLILLFMLLVVACSSPDRRLQQAEQLMEQHPDSAMRLLQQIPPQKISGKANRALYALLMSQALDKNDVKSDNDSLISIATDYYDESQPERAGYAWFYHSRTANNRGDATEQAAHLLRAQEYAEKTDNFKLKGLIYGDKGLMYRSQRQFDSAVCYFDKAYYSFKAINDSRCCIIYLINKGYTAQYINNIPLSLSSFRLAEKYTRKCNNTLLISTLYKSIGNVYFQQFEYKNALSYYHKTPIVNDTKYDSNKYYLLAKTYLKLDQLDSAQFYLMKVHELGEMAPDYYRLCQDLYEKKDDIKKIIFFADKSINSIDSLYNKKLEVSFAGLEKKYKYQGLQIVNQQLEIKNNRKNLYLLISLMVLISLGLVFALWRLKVKREELKIQAKLLAVEKSLVQTETEKFEKEHENNVLLERQLKLQSILLLNIEQHRKNAIMRPANKGTGQEIRRQQNDILYQELIACMDLEYNNITHRLKEQYTSLTKQDIQIACLLLAGFETGMIATMLDVKIESMHVNRSRLRKKLNLSTSVDLEDFLLHF